MQTSLSPARRRGLVVAAAAGLAVATLAIPAGAASAHPRHHSAYSQVNLVSDQPGVAAITDPDLVNAWGLSQGPTSPVWVSDNGTDLSTLYTGAGVGQTPAKAGLVVTIPGGAPTGQVFNPTTGFTLSNGKPALFVFAGEDGDVTAWNPQLSPNTSAEHVGDISGGILKGIALLDRSKKPRLLVADFGHGRIVVLNSRFMPVRLPHRAFRDRKLPAGYSPFNVAVVGSRVFVSYAVKEAGGEDDVAGPGNGIVDVYSSHGRLLQRFARHGVLNSPWGMAIAPERFGEFSGDLLVGNFGDGRINAFDPWSGHFRGALRDRHGKAISIDGLWGLLPGNGTSAGVNDLWFSAGPGGEEHGLLGVLRVRY